MAKKLEEFWDALDTAIETYVEEQYFDDNEQFLNVKLTIGGRSEKFGDKECDYYAEGEFTGTINIEDYSYTPESYWEPSWLEYTINYHGTVIVKDENGKIVVNEYVDKTL